jgi:hypothetical protein
MLSSGSREARATTRREPQPGSPSNADDLGGTIVTHPVGTSRATVVDLEIRRHGRYLQLTSSVQVPCVGVCRCWGGVPLGGWSA